MQRGAEIMRKYLDAIVRKLRAPARRVWFGTTERERWCILIIALLMVIGSVFKLMRLKGVV
jgi:hypothetical protein